MPKNCCWSNGPMKGQSRRNTGSRRCLKTSPFALVDLAKLRWRIEPDYQELKQEVGLAHYEGRGWRGFQFSYSCSPLLNAEAQNELCRTSTTPVSEKSGKNDPTRHSSAGDINGPVSSAA